MLKKMNMINTAGWMAVALGVLLAMVGPAAAQSSADYLPTARVVYPNLSPLSVKIVPTTFKVGVIGTDPDAQDGLPAKWRMLLVSAQYGTGPGGEPRYIRTPNDFDQYGEDLLPWDHPEWSEWIDYSPEQADRLVSFPEMAEGYFLVAVQTMDADGAVSTDRRYQIEVMNLQTMADRFRPEVTLSEPFLGTTPASEASYEIAVGQPLNFFWSASAAAYNGEIASFRYGWDLVDPNDPNDPGWAVPPTPDLEFAPERSFQEGIHVFYLRVEDTLGQVRLVKRNLIVIPFLDPAFQLDLLLVDQVVDKNSYRWPDSSGVPRDTDDLRDAFWSFLGDGSGGVAGFDPDRDWYDDTDQIKYSDVVQYRAVLCYARLAEVGQRMFDQFRPENDVDKFVWMTPYQQRGGNLFLVGSESMASFIESKPNYMVPMIFDTSERYIILGETTYEVGFGQTELPDGSLVSRGPRQYPYATAGIAAIDWTSPDDKNIYARTLPAKFDRRADCVGLKAIVLDDAFKSTHGVAPGAMADTIQTDGIIDWQDGVHAATDTLGLSNRTFVFRTDEFYDSNISTRSTPIVTQDCDGAPCVEPMWRGIARMDWMREYYRGQGEDWPASRYTPNEREAACGPLALTGFEEEQNASARTNDRVYGFFSYKSVADKPSGKADVYWGFDPYRFDHAETKKAVRWVLDYFGLNINP